LQVVLCLVQLAAGFVLRDHLQERYDAYMLHRNPPAEVRSLALA
jgi:hypothetical protein